MSRHIIRNNEFLILGTGVLIVGVVLATYSFSTYIEMQNLENRIDFESVDKNNQISSSEKYYRYMEYSDFLNMKLKENSKIPMKRVSCIYLDYAKHNAVNMYNLTKYKLSSDEMKMNYCTDNVKILYDTLSKYKSCPQSAGYKVILGEILEDINNSAKEKEKADERLNEFLYGSSTRLPQNLETGDIETESEMLMENNGSQTAQQDAGSIPNYIDNEGKAQTLTSEQIEYINQQQAKHGG